MKIKIRKPGMLAHSAKKSMVSMQNHLDQAIASVAKAVTANLVPSETQISSDVVQACKAFYIALNRHDVHIPKKRQAQVRALIREHLIRATALALPSSDRTVEVVGRGMMVRKRRIGPRPPPPRSQVAR